MPDVEIVPSSQVGGTAVAIMVAVIVLVIVSSLGTVALTFMYHYISWMPWALASIFGLAVSAYFGVAAARYSCDAVVRSYSHKAVFVALCIVFALVIVGEYGRGFDDGWMHRLGQTALIAWLSWMTFWRNEFIN
jgi:hypothetical protein